MRISELAARSGTTVKTLRFYEETSLPPEPMRTLSGYRDDGASPCSAATDLLDQHLTTITNRIHVLQTEAVLILLEEDRRSWAR